MDVEPTSTPQPERLAPPVSQPATPPVAAPPADVVPSTTRRTRALDAATITPPKKWLGRARKSGDVRGRSGIWHVYLPPTDPHSTKLREQVESHCRALGIPLSVWQKRAAAAAVARETAKSTASEEATRAAIAAAVAEALAAEKAKAKRRGNGIRS